VAEEQPRVNPEAAKVAPLNQINVGGGNEGAVADQVVDSQLPSEQRHQNEGPTQEKEAEEAKSNLMSSHSPKSVPSKVQMDSKYKTNMLSKLIG